MSTADGGSIVQDIIVVETEDGAANVYARLGFEGISRLLDASRGNFIVEPIASLLFATALWRSGDARQIGLWLALVWAAAVLRALLSLQIQRTDPPGEILREWGFAVSAATCLAGGLWASGLLFLWPPDAGLPAFILIVAIMAVAGVVMVTVAAHGPAVTFYLLMTSAVATICLIWQQPANSNVFMQALLVLSLLLATLGWWLNRLYAGQARLRAELDAAHEAAKAAHRAKSEFVANISHELRTPLNAINGFSEIIKDQAFGPIDNQHYLEYANDIYNSGSRLLEVINDILDLSNLETGNMHHAEESVDVVEVVRSVVDATQTRAEDSGVTLQKVLPEAPVFIQTDRQLIRQILANLVSNAVKFTPLGGEVAVEVKFAPNDDLIMIVNDNGIGMSPEDISTAMVPFGQVDASLARRFEGTGLGIPLVKSLVELLGGTFRLQSELSVGTRAVATFPAQCVQQ